MRLSPPPKQYGFRQPIDGHLFIIVPSKNQVQAAGFYITVVQYEHLTETPKFA